MADQLEQELRRVLAAVDADPDTRWVLRLRDDLTADWHGVQRVTVGPVAASRTSRPQRLALAAAAMLVAATLLTLFIIPRVRNDAELPPAVTVESPSAEHDGNRVVFETTVGRIEWTRVVGPLSPVASSAVGVFTLRADSLGIHIRQYEGASSSWHEVATVTAADRWTGLGRITSDGDLYFFSIDDECQDLALGDGGLAPSPGAEGCLALEQSSAGGVTFERFELPMPDPFVPLGATVTSSGEISLLDAMGTGDRGHRYWATANGRWQFVEVPWQTNVSSSGGTSPSIVADGEGFIAYSADGSAAWRSTDAITWIPVENLGGLPVDAEGVLVTRAPDTWVALTKGTLFVSREGVEWERLGSFADSLAWEELTGFGEGAVLVPTTVGSCSETDRASLRVTADGSTWSELLQGAGPLSTGFNGAPVEGQVCVQVAGDTIIIDLMTETGESAGAWLGRLEERDG